MVAASTAAAARIHLGPRLIFTGIGGRRSFSVQWAEQHKWLGLVWRGDRDWLPQARVQLGKASAALACLLGMVASQLLPLPIALNLFESKVDSVFAVGR